MNKYEKVEIPIGEVDLVALEKTLNVELPSDFKEHYKKTNGGYPPASYVNGVEYVFSIDGFIPIKHGSMTIEKLLDSYHQENLNFGKNLPFANDSGGNIFFLSLEPENYGRVYLWEHDAGTDLEKSFTYVCASFFDFINGLTEEA